MLYLIRKSQNVNIFKKNHCFNIQQNIVSTFNKKTMMIVLIVVTKQTIFTMSSMTKFIHEYITLPILGCDDEKKSEEDVVVTRNDVIHARKQLIDNLVKHSQLDDAGTLYVRCEVKYDDFSHVRIYGDEYLDRLPGNMCISSLSLCSLPNLRVLPDVLCVDNTLEIIDCNKITRIPPQNHSYELVIKDCRGFN